MQNLYGRYLSVVLIKTIKEFYLYMQATIASTVFLQNVPFHFSVIIQTLSYSIKWPPFYVPTSFSRNETVNKVVF